MYMENNTLKFVHIGDLRDEIVEEIKARNINNAYFGENYVLTTSDESNKEVYDVISEILDDEDIEYIKTLSLKNIEEYVELCYQQEYYEILGVDGEKEEECENVMEIIVSAFNDGELSEEDLSNWETLIDKTVKQCVMETVSDALRDKITELKEQGYDVSVLKDLFK